MYISKRIKAAKGKGVMQGLLRGTEEVGQRGGHRGFTESVIFS